MNDVFKNNTEGEGFSSVDLIYQCLIDKEKFEAFYSILKNNIKSNSSVLDVGTGSGILALVAGSLNAEKVLALEFDPTVAQIANNNFKQNNLEDKIKIIVGDARNIDLSKYNFDIIVMELLATGLVDEMQVEAINNLCKQNLINEDTVMIPFAQENFLSLANTDFNLYGFNMKMIKHLWSHDNDQNSFRLLSEKTSLNKIIFNKYNNLNFSGIIKFTVKETGLINSLCLTSRIIVDNKNKIVLDSTHSLNPIVFIPISEKLVNKDEEISIKVDYIMGGGFNNFNVNYLTN